MLQRLFFLLAPIIKPLKRFNVGFLYLPAHDLSRGLTRRYEILVTALAVFYQGRIIKRTPLITAKKDTPMRDPEFHPIISGELLICSDLPQHVPLKHQPK